MHATRATGNQFHGPRLYVRRSCRGRAMSHAKLAWSRAAICVDRAHAADDEETRRFFTALRDSWVRVANTCQLAESLKADVRVTRPMRKRAIGAGTATKPRE